MLIGLLFVGRTANPLDCPSFVGRLDLSARREIVALLAASDHTGLVWNGTYILSAPVKLESALTAVIERVSGEPKRLSDRTVGFERCRCTRRTSKSRSHVTFRLCPNHKRVVTAVLVDAGIRLPPPPRPRRKKKVGAVAKGIVVSGGLPSLGRR